MSSAETNSDPRTPCPPAGRHRAGPHRSGTHRAGPHRASRFGKGSGRRCGAWRVGTVLAAGVLLAATLIAPGGAASSAPLVAQSEGRFLGGAVLGTDLDAIAGLAPATAANSGGPSATDLHPLDATVLNSMSVPLGGGGQLLGAGGVLTVGAINQYAQANPDGSSHAASGAVTDGGAIGIGQAGVQQSTASLTLDALLPGAVTSAIANLSLGVGALAATADQAAGAFGTQTGDYGIEHLGLDVTSPLLADVTSTLRATLGALQPTVDGIAGLIGADGVLCPLGPGLCLVSVTGLPTLTDLVAALGSVTSADGSITADLQTGAISIDVAQVLSTAGVDLNNLNPNTQLLPYVTGALTSQLLPAVTSALGDLAAQISAAVNGVTVTLAGLPVPVGALGALTTILSGVASTVTAPVTAVSGALVTTLITPLADALSGVLSLLVNVQLPTPSDPHTTFTERALQVDVLGAAGAVQLDLASASVGPNAGPAAAVVPTAAGLNPTHGPVAGGTTVTMSGTGFVPGATTVTIDGATVAAVDVTVNAPGTSLTFSTPAHAAGPVGVTATTAGGTTAPALTYTYDPLVAVPAPIITTPVDGSTVSTPSPTIGGTGVAGDTVTVTEAGTTICAATVDGAGRWSCLPSAPLSTGAHAVGATQSDPGGGVSGPSNSVTFTVVAAGPVAGSLHPAHGPAAGGTSVTVTGAGFVPAQTSITIGGRPVAAADVMVAAAGTSLTFGTPSHSPGPVSVVVTTPAGDSNPLGYTYDPVAAPVITHPADGATVTTPTPPIGGTGTPGDTVTVSEAGTLVCTATVAVDGTWSGTPSSGLSAGEHTVSATQADAAGNVSPQSNRVTFRLEVGSSTGVNSGPSTGLPVTGANLAVPLGWAAVLFVFGSALLLLARRRAH